MNEIILSAIVPAVISLVVAILTIKYNYHKLDLEEKRQERELQRRVTEKLIDLRLKSYPKAFLLTDDLRGDLILNNNHKITSDYFRNVQINLINWHKEHAGFLLTRKSQNAFFELKRALPSEFEDAYNLNKDQRLIIFKTKNAFRSALREDLGILYVEDESEIK